MKNPLLPSFAAALCTMVLATSAQADSKAFTSLECFAATSSQAGDLVRSTIGIKNNASTNRVIYCPLVRDEDNAIVSPVRVAPWYKIGTVDGKITCSAYHGSSAGDLGFVTVTATSGVKPAGTKDSVSIDLLSTPVEWSQVQIFLVCTLGPGVTLSHIYVNEPNPTDGG